MPFLGVTSREWVWYKGRGLPATPRTCSTMNICAGARGHYQGRLCVCDGPPWFKALPKPCHPALLLGAVVGDELPFPEHSHNCRSWLYDPSVPESLSAPVWLECLGLGEIKADVILMFKTWRKRHSPVPVFGPDCQTRVSMVALQGCVGQDRAACGAWSILGTT